MHVFPINYFEFSLFVILTFLTIDISLSLQIMTPSRRDQTFLKNVKKMRIILKFLTSLNVVFAASKLRASWGLSSTFEF